MKSKNGCNVFTVSILGGNNTGISVSVCTGEDKCLKEFTLLNSYLLYTVLYTTLNLYWPLSR